MRAVRVRTDVAVRAGVELGKDAPGLLLHSQHPAFYEQVHSWPEARVASDNVIGANDVWLRQVGPGGGDPASLPKPGRPSDMRLASWPGGFGRVEGNHVVRMGPDLVRFLETGMAHDLEHVPLTSVALGAPVPRPSKVIGVGLNYQDHAKETGQRLPSEPPLFAKFANSIVGPGSPIVIPEVSDQIDYEAELGVVIGRAAKNVPPDEALSYVAGYYCVNDVSARDLQFGNGQWTRGKAIDTFLPTGPYLVTADEIPDPQRLAIRCLLNGVIVQDSSTEQMVFGVTEIVSLVSQTMTLESGDLIATGTPPGVGFGREPPLFLWPGDLVTVQIEGIGDLTNPVNEYS